MTQTQIHASCVSFANAGLIILGASGQGKSTLALELMAFGATLVADDRVDLKVVEGVLWAQAPAQIAGKIEARGLGILSADFVRAAAVVAAVDLDMQATMRLPIAKNRSFLSVEIPLFARVKGEGFAAKLIQYLRQSSDSVHLRRKS